MKEAPLPLYHVVQTLLDIHILEHSLTPKRHAKLKFTSKK